MDNPFFLPAASYAGSKLCSGNVPSPGITPDSASCSIAMASGPSSVELGFRPMTRLPEPTTSVPRAKPHGGTCSTQQCNAKQSDSGYAAHHQQQTLVRSPGGTRAPNKRRASHEAYTHAETAPAAIDVFSAAAGGAHAALVPCTKALLSACTDALMHVECCPTGGIQHWTLL